MEIITWNVNYDDRAIGEFEKYDWDHRKAAIGEFVKSHMNSIFHFQEVMPKYMTEIEDWLCETHVLFSMQVHPCGRQNVSAYPASLNNLEQVDVPPPSEKHRRVFLRVENDECVFYNVHFPMAEEFREAFTKQLCDLTRNETRKVVVTGDFNSFPDGNGFEQTFQIQREGNLYAATSVMKDFDHIFVKGIVHQTPRVYVNSSSDHYAISMEFQF